MNAQALLTLNGIRKSYAKGSGEELVVLDDVKLDLHEGEIVALLGRSGSGKSTLLRIVAGLIAPSAGEARYAGRDVRGPGEGIAMVFQTFALFPWLTVLGNVELGLEALDVPPAERRRRALAAIDLIGLDGFESAWPKELSGGMRQRIGFARALVVQPQLLLMDEPFSALDILTAETLRTDFLDLWAEGRMPIKSVLMVTHNIEEAVLMADRILVFASNPGRVAAELTVGLPHPRHRLDPEFRRLVDTIYARMTAGRPARDTANEIFPGLGIGSILPEVSTNQLAGLLEAVQNRPYGGRADLPSIAQDLQMEVDQLFPLAETLQLLRFAELTEGDIVLTEAGRRFAGLEPDGRKRLFANHLAAYVPLVALIRKVLDERPSRQAPFSRFDEQLQDYMTARKAEQTLRVVIDWGRYAELFSYDESTGLFGLDDPD